MKNKSRASSFNTGIASEYLVLSKLFRMDLEAYISQGNKKSIDIRIIKDDGQSVSIDVKSVRGYSSLVINNVITLENHFIVFVIYNNKFDNVLIEPDIFVVPSIEIPNIKSVFGKQERMMKGQLEGYRDKWSYFKV